VGNEKASCKKDRKEQGKSLAFYFFQGGTRKTENFEGGLTGGLPLHRAREKPPNADHMTNASKEAL